MSRTEVFKRVLIRLVLFFPLLFLVYFFQNLESFSWFFMFFIFSLIVYGIFVDWFVAKYFAINIVSFTKQDLEKSSDSVVYFDIGGLLVLLGIISLFLPTLLKIFFELDLMFIFLFYFAGIISMLIGLFFNFKGFFTQKKLNESKLKEHVESQAFNKEEAEKRLKEYKKRSYKFFLIFIPILVGLSFVILSPYFFEESIFFLILITLVVMLFVAWFFWEAEQQRKIIFLDEVDFFTGIFGKKNKSENTN